MKKFTNPLDKIRVASPCSADWNQMYGNERKRFCADCKLNVYNLSEMSRDEAENFLTASEGRVCVRYFRRADGTVLTKDCPVGWRAMKQRVSRVATAAFSIVVGFLSSLFAVRAMDSAKATPNIRVEDVPTISISLPPVAEFPAEPARGEEQFEMLGQMMIEPSTKLQGGFDTGEFRSRFADQKTNNVDRRRRVTKLR